MAELRLRGRLGTVYHERECEVSSSWQWIQKEEKYTQARREFCHVFG